MRHSRGLLPLTVVASELTLGATAYEGRGRGVGQTHGGRVTRQPSLICNILLMDSSTRRENDFRTNHAAKNAWTPKEL